MACDQVLGNDLQEEMSCQGNGNAGQTRRWAPFFPRSCMWDAGVMVGAPAAWTRGEPRTGQVRQDNRRSSYFSPSLSCSPALDHRSQKRSKRFSYLSHCCLGIKILTDTHFSQGLVGRHEILKKEPRMLPRANSVGIVF